MTRANEPERMFNEHRTLDGVLEECGLGLDDRIAVSSVETWVEGEDFFMSGTGPSHFHPMVRMYEAVFHTENGTTVTMEVEKEYEP